MILIIVAKFIVPDGRIKPTGVNDPPVRDYEFSNRILPKT
jgi:hypothetical protein